MTDDFDAFVKRQQRSMADFDSERERADWLKRINDLYGLIEQALAEYTRSGTISITYQEVSMFEEAIGRYPARRMTIRIGDRMISLKPKGAFVIGAKGRVDLTGPADSSRFVVVPKHLSGPSFKIASRPEVESGADSVEWVWKLATKPPNIRYVELTKESIRHALMEAAGG